MGDGDRRVRRPQPPLRRPRLPRRLPAAVDPGLGHARADHGPGLRHAQVRLRGPGDRAPLRGPGRAGPEGPALAPSPIATASAPARRPPSTSSTAPDARWARSASSPPAWPSRGCGGGDDERARAAPPRPGPAASRPSRRRRSRPRRPRSRSPTARARRPSWPRARSASSTSPTAPRSRRRQLAVNSEQTLDGLRWSGWGNPSTTGRGQVETLICDPTCAQGRLEASTAVIVLSKPRRCGGSRFYTRSTLTYKEPKTGRTRAPDTYLRTPPC